jgi:hypothetical protein
VPATTWAPQTPEQKYGWKPPAPAGGQQTVELTAVPTPSIGAAVAGNPLHPENPLFWIGLIGAATFGLMAFSTNVRVGNAKAGLSVGDPK